MSPHLATSNLETLLVAVVAAAGGEVRVSADQLQDGGPATRLLVDYDPQTGALLLRTTKEPHHDDHPLGATGAQP